MLMLFIHHILNTIKTTIPIIILYTANILKLPVCKYFNKNLITTIPTKKLTKIPTKNGTLKTKSFILNIVAANTIGADNIKEYLAADSRSIPIALAVVIVTPDLETPGMNASDCDNPIKNVCLKVISSYFTLDFAFLSITYKIIPIKINAQPIISGFVNISAQ